MLIPYQVDVPMKRWPVANFAIIGLTVVIFMALFSTTMNHNGYGDFDAMILDGWSLSGLLGHLWLHADWMHLIGNMIFLWVFGNAVCAKVGNIWYPLLYLGLGLLAATAHNVFDGDPGIGASGAINGVVGMFLVLYPLNSIRCFYLFWFHPGTFSISSYWMILLWLAFDLLGVALGGQSVAYWAHLGGFAAGFFIASALVHLDVIRMESTERSLLDLIARTEQA